MSTPALVDPPAPADQENRRWQWLRRVVRHEWSQAGLAALLLAVAMTWPTLAQPARTIPQDFVDPTLQAWQIAWGGHALLTDPSRLWHANAFWPEPYSYAFSDTLLGYAPAGMIGSGPVAALVRYNVLFVLAFALASFGAYVLARQLGAGRLGAAVAGVAFAYAPWRLGHGGHLNVLSTGGIALALAMLVRGHGWSLRPGPPGPHRPRWALAGWLVAAWQLSLSFGTGLPFGYLLAAGAVVAGVRFAVSRARRRPFDQSLLLANLAGGALFAIVALVLAQPYLRVAELHPDNARTVSYITLFSPTLSDFAIAPAESWTWGWIGAGARADMLYPGETTLLPGLTLVVLAVIGLFRSVWRRRWRIALGLGVVVAVVLALGPLSIHGGEPGYVTLFKLLPGWNAMRTPGRLVIWVTLLLGLLAAGAVSTFASKPTTGRRWAWLPPGRAVALAALVLVLVEGFNVTPHPIVPAPAVPVSAIEAPLLVLPIEDYADDFSLLWSTDGFPAMANGISGILPDSQITTTVQTLSFPDPASVAYLREIGIRTVLVLPEWTDGTPWAGVTGKPIAGLGITRTELNGDVIYRL